MARWRAAVTPHARTFCSPPKATSPPITATGGSMFARRRRHPKLPQHHRLQPAPQHRERQLIATLRGRQHRRN
jgi:hypothetical protein